jgi:hypothetical protein
MSTVEPHETRSDEAENAWQTVAQVLQAIAALAAFGAWVVVVGGIRVWARLQAAKLPQPVRTVTLLPRETLIAEGVRALAVTAIAAAGSGLFVYLLATVVGRDADAREMARLRAAVVATAVAVAVALTVIRLWDVQFNYWLGLGALTMAVVALVILALLAWRGTGALALTIATAILVWGGGFDLISERGTDSAKFEPVRFIRKDGTGSQGLLLARGKDTLTLICPKVNDWRSLLAVPTAGIAQTTFEHPTTLDKYVQRRDEEMKRQAKAKLAEEARRAKARKGTKADKSKTIVVVDCAKLPAAKLQPPGVRENPAPPTPPITQVNDGSTTVTVNSDSSASSVTSNTTIVRVYPSPPPGSSDGVRLVKARQIARRPLADRGYLVRLGYYPSPVSGVVSVRTFKPLVLASGLERRVRLATKSFRVDAREPVLIRFWLSPFARRQLHANRTMRIRIVVTAHDREGRAHTDRLNRFTLRDRT